MKSLDNVLKPIGERINSPLYSTFILAWLVSNWKIFYVTFIMSPEDLYTSKLNYVQYYIKDYWHMLIYPLGFTTAYIIIFPYIEKWVLKIWYRNKADRKKIIVERMEKSPVTGEEHRALLMKYINREQELTNFNEKEKNWLNERATLTDKYNEVNLDNIAKAQEISVLNERLKQYTNSPDLNTFFSGRWNLKFRNSQNSKDAGEEYFYISQRDYYIENHESPDFHMEFFFYNVFSNVVVFLKKRLDDKNPELLFNQLWKIDDVTFEGTELSVKNGVNNSKLYVTYKVTYRRSGHDPFNRKDLVAVPINSYTLT